MRSTLASARAHILVAEDEPDIRDILVEELIHEGYAVVAASDGLEAVAALVEGEFDVVISDVRMPGLSGLDVLRAVKKTSPGTQVVITTAFGSMQTAIDCLRAGAFDFLPKPIGLEGMIETVERAVEQRRLRANALLHEASRAIFTTREPEKLPGVIVQAARKLLDADDVELMLAGGDGLLYVACAAGIEPEGPGIDERLALAQRVAGTVESAARGPARTGAGIEPDPRLVGLDTAHATVHSAVVHPLVAGDRLVGAVAFHRNDSARPPFRRGDVERATVLASQALLAIENARLVRQMLAQERLASMGQVAAGVAHEISNPATYVLTNLGYLRDGIARLATTVSAPSPEFAVLLERLKQAAFDAHEGALRIREIVRDVGALARTDLRGGVAFDLNEAIRSALRMTSAETRGRARVVVHLGPDAMVRGSLGPMSQVFINLLTNAAQAMAGRAGPRNEIVVSSRRAGDQVIADVVDTGPGIPRELLRTIFEPFFTTKAPGAGTGLGLTISREIVRRHGGEIHVESVEGHGTTFTLIVPAAPPDAVFPSSPPRTQPVQPVRAIAAGDVARRARILFVDDEPGILRSYERLFGDDADVTLVEGGQQALAVLALRQDFDLVVCDLVMPGVTGIDVYHHLEAMHPRLASAVLFVTGSAALPEVSDFVRSMARDRVIEKPLDGDALRVVLDGALARRGIAALRAGDDRGN